MIYPESEMLLILTPRPFTEAMSYSISTLLTRNLHDVFGENDPARLFGRLDAECIEPFQGGRFRLPPESPSHRRPGPVRRSSRSWVIMKFLRVCPKTSGGI